MIIEHISVSRKSTFDECNAKYNYKYHQKLKTDEPEQEYFAFGKIIHKIAEHYVMDQGKTDIQLIASQVLRGKIPLEQNKPAPRLSEEYKKKLPDHIRHLKAINDKIGFDGKLEWQFRYDLDPPNGKFITGFIDRLIIRGDNYFILDYKTTKKGYWRKTKNTISNDLQLRCYGRVVQKEFNAKAENIRAALYYVSDGQLVSCRFNDKLLMTAEEDLLRTHNNIAAMPPEEAYGRTGDHCKRCEFRKNVCTFYSLT